MFPRSISIRSCAAGALVLLAATTAGAQTTGSAEREITDTAMGAASFELNAKVACGEGRPDAVDYALRSALEGADLLPARASEMRRGIREAHAALTQKGGCRGYPAKELAAIRERHETRGRELARSGGELELRLPASMGGELTGRASYGTVALNGVPLTVLCMETAPGERSAKLVLIAPSREMLAEGNRDLARIGARARVTLTPAAGDPDIQYAMLRISEPEGQLVKGSLGGFFRAGTEMFTATFTAVPSEDPCGIKREAARR